MRKAIILAAGKSTRTYPLTINKPKPLLKVLDKSILEHNLDCLSKLVDEIIIIVGFQKEMIKDKIGNEYDGIKIKYVEQSEQLGTAHALLMAEQYIEIGDQVIIIGSDDLHSPKDMKRLVAKEDSILAKRVDNPTLYGIFQVNEKNHMTGLVEKPEYDAGNLANTGCYHLGGKIMSYLKGVKKSERDEIEFTDALQLYSLGEEKQLNIIEVQDYWIPITYPWHYLEANIFMLAKMAKSSIKGHIEANVQISGNVHLGNGSIIKSGSYIEGPVFIGDNCIIGPNAYIRKDSVIMDKVNTRAEIVDSVIMDNTTAKHSCYIGHSVIGEFVNIAAGTITSDYRHDAAEHTTIINGKKVFTRRKKLGTFIGDNVKTGIGTLIYPGRKIWAGKTTLPGQIVTKDIV